MMNYRLRLNIGRDKTRWTWEGFYKERDNFYKNIIEQFRDYKGRVNDLWVEFANGNPQLANSLVEIAEKRKYIYDIGVLIDYTAKEIREAKYVRLMALGDCVDHDKDYKFLNKYKKLECQTCGRPDYEQLPDPYFTYEIVLRKKKDIYYAQNGIIVLSQWAFDSIRNYIEPWIDFGYPNIVNENGTITSNQHRYLWIRPKYSVGKYINEEVIQRCSECGEPIRVAKSTEGDIFIRAKEIISSFCDSKAPIVRCNSWFGNFPPGSEHSRGHDVFISGSLHEKIRKLKLKAFVDADYVIHAADEPYEWDPLGDLSPLSNGQLDCIKR
jgi:hypothetical protein